MVVAQWPHALVLRSGSKRIVLVVLQGVKDPGVVEPQVAQLALLVPGRAVLVVLQSEADRCETGRVAHGTE